MWLNATKGWLSWGSEPWVFDPINGFYLACSGHVSRMLVSMYSSFIGVWGGTFLLEVGTLMELYLQLCRQFTNTVHSTYPTLPKSWMCAQAGWWQRWMEAQPSRTDKVKTHIGWISWRLTFPNVCIDLVDLCPWDYDAGDECVSSTWQFSSHVWLILIHWALEAGS